MSRLAWVGVTAAMLAMTAAPAAASHGGGRPSPGAADSGDPLFPGLGNGGYDVGHYTLDLTYATTDSVQAIPVVETIQARATQAL